MVIIHEKDDMFFDEILEADIESLREMHNAPDTLHMLTDNTEVSSQNQKKWFEGLNKSAGSKKYALRIRENGKAKLAGMIRLDNIDQVNKNMLVGMDIMHAYRGKGIGKKGFHLILEYAFHILEMHKVSLFTAEFNVIAKNLYEKMGFHQEGLLKENLLREDKYYDLYLLSLFREEYEKNCKVKK